MVRFKPQFSKKIFPFAPGIPWTIKNKLYVIPEIDKKIWDFALSDKNFIITCLGGFLESFFSFSYFEAIKKIEPYRNIQWLGYDYFKPLCKMYGIKFSNKLLNSDIVDKYPAPIFMDEDNNAYFNVLNNYINFKSFNGVKNYLNHHICFKQLFDNCLLPWEFNIPKFQNLDSKKYQDWKRNNNFNDNKKFIVIFPKSNQSIHDIECIDWSDKQIRELGELLIHKNISVVSCGSDTYDIYYKSAGVFRATLDFEIILNLMNKCYGVISRDIDNLFITMMLNNDSIIFSNVIKGKFSNSFDLYKNSEFLRADNVIYTGNNLLPIDIFNILN